MSVYLCVYLCMYLCVCVYVHADVSRYTAMFIHVLVEARSKHWMSSFIALYLSFEADLSLNPELTNVTFLLAGHL